MSETTKKRRNNKQQWWKEQVEKNQQGHGERQTMEQQQSEGNRRKEHEERQGMEQPQQQREGNRKKEHEERQRMEQPQQQRVGKIWKQHEERQRMEQQQREGKIWKEHEERQGMEQPQQQREGKIWKEHEERQRIQQQQQQQQQQREEKIRKEPEEQQQLDDEQQDELDALCQKQKAIKKKREELEKEQRDKEEQLRKIQKALDEQRQLEEKLNNQWSELIIRQRLERKELKEKHEAESNKQRRVYKRSMELAEENIMNEGLVPKEIKKVKEEQRLDERGKRHEERKGMKHGQLDERETKKHENKKMMEQNRLDKNHDSDRDYRGQNLEEQIELKISPRIRQICEKAHVTEEQLKDPEIAKFIHRFVEVNSPENPGHSPTSAFGPEESKSKVKNKLMSLEEKDKLKIKWSEQKRSKKHREKLQSLLEERTETRRLGPLRVCFNQEFLIGSGSCGTLVYAGFSKDGSEVAIKRLVRNATAEAFFMENEKEISQLVEDRNSENIVSYRKFERAQNFAYVVLDLCEQSLANYVKSNNEEYLQHHGPRIIKEILTGLLVLHSGTRKVLHMDLKPENVLVDWEGRMRLADFGISREVREGYTTVDTGHQKGTDGWTAVECIKREGIERLKPSRKSDIQVVGMISFYVLTKGEHLFGKTMDRTRNIINGNPVNLEKLTDDLARAFVWQLIRHDKDERPYAEEALNHPYLKF